MRDYSLTLLAFLALFSTFCCSRRESHSSTIFEAEKLVHTQPQISLGLLESIEDMVPYMAYEEQNHYKNLRILVENKLEKPPLSDSVLNVLIDYYESVRNANELARAYYLKAAYYQEKNDREKHLHWLNKCLNIADTTKTDVDWDLLSAAYSWLCNDLINEGLMWENLEYAKKEYSLLPHCKNQLALHFDMGYAYALVGKTDSASFFYKKYMEGCEADTGNIDVRQNWKNIIFAHFCKAGDKKQAERWKPYFKVDSNKQETYAFLGNYFLMSGNIDSAVYCYKKARLSERVWAKCSANRSLFKIYMGRQEADSALHYAKEAIDAYRSLHEEIEIESTARINKIYDNAKAKEENVALREKNLKIKFHLAMALSVICLILLCSVAVIVFYKKHKQREINQARAKLATAEKLSASHKETIESLEMKLANSAKTIKNKEELEIQCRELSNLFRESSILRKGEKTARKEDLEQLSRVFCSLYAEQIKQLQDIYPKLSKDDIHYIMLVALNFQAFEVNRLLEISSQASYSRRKKIIQKLQSSEIGSVSKNEKYDFYSFKAIIKRLFE